MRAAWILVLGLSMFAGDAIAAPPNQLKGKSVVVNWTETREQRLVEKGGAYRQVTVPIVLSTYVSANGRVFNRLQSSGRRGGSNDQVSGEQRSGRIPTFKGRTMSLTQGFGGQGLARRTVVEFDETFSSCSATVITGKQSGAEVGYMRALGGGMQEIRSTKISGITCAVRASNVFQ